MKNVLKEIGRKLVNIKEGISSPEKRTVKTTHSRQKNEKII